MNKQAQHKIIDAVTEQL